MSTKEQQLKELLESANPGHAVDDMRLSHVLAAQGGDIPRSLQMYQKILKWRQDNNVDTMLAKPNKLILTKRDICIKSTHYEYDKQGRPLYWMKLGQLPLMLLKYITLKDAAYGHIFDMETMWKRCQEQTKKLGKPVTTGFNVFDLEDLNTQLIYNTSGFLNTISEIDKDYYPFTLGQSIFVKCYFETPVSAVVMGLDAAGLLPADVKGKILICSESTQMQQLTEFIDENVVPEHYGGKNKDAPMAKTLATPNCEETEQTLVAFEKDTLQIEDTIVPAGKVHEVQYVIDTSADGPVDFMWYFRSSDYTTVFSVDFVTAAGEVQAIVPAAKVNCVGLLISDQHTFKETGVVTLKWDNTAAWMYPVTMIRAEFLNQQRARK